MASTSIDISDATSRSPVAVIKRQGSVAPFQLERIVSAIASAGMATGTLDVDEAHRLAKAVKARLQARVP